MNIIEQKSTKSTMTNKHELRCDICNYKCSDSSNFKKHINTKKHKTLIYEQPVNTIESGHTKSTKNTHVCKICNKSYKNRNGLWYHKQKCVKEPVENIYNKNGNDMINLLISENKDFKNIIFDLVKSNTDLQKQMMGQAMGGKEEFVDSENKIMKKIAKAVLIDKAS